MDYGNLFKRAWDIIWNNKFLILLGILVALGGSGGGGVSSTINFSSDLLDGDIPSPFTYNFDTPYFNGDLGSLAVVAIILLVLLMMVVGLAFWVITTISQGGLIFGADKINQGGITNFSEAFSMGWKRVMRLIGIGLVPAIPMLLLAFFGLISLFLYVGPGRWIDGGIAQQASNWVFAGIAMVLICVLGLASTVLGLLSTLAYRACMLEDMGVIDSYRRGIEVLRQELGSVIILFLLQLVVRIGIGLALFVPNILMSLCCVLWPVLLIVQGGIAAYFSTLWTLAWSEWTNSRVKELEPAL